MTKEQIESLKPGDKFIVEYTVDRIAVLAHGEPYVYVVQQDVWLNPFPTKKGKTLQNAKLVKPPCKFNIGDLVQIVPDPMTGTVHGNACMYGDWVLGPAKIMRETIRNTEMQVALQTGSIIRVNVHCLKPI